MQRLCAALLSVLFVFAGASVASAEALTEDQVTRFIATLDAANAFGDELDAAGKTDALEIAMTPQAGEEFKPYSKAVAAMKTKYPADYAHLGALVSPHGYSADDWAATGDRVILAYFAVKMERENPGAAEQMAAMDPSMLAMLPPAQKAEFEAMRALIATVQAVPEEDRAVVGPHMDALEVAMDA